MGQSTWGSTSANMSRFIVLAILVASANAYQTFTGYNYAATDCSGAIQSKLIIPVGLCSYKLKITPTSTGMSAQFYTDAMCTTADGTAYTQTTAELTTGTCVVIDNEGWKFTTEMSTNAYAVKSVWSAPSDLAGSTIYLASDSCLTFGTTKSLKFASTSATQTTPQAWGSSATCTGTVDESPGVQGSPANYDDTIDGSQWTAVIEIVTLDSSGSIIIGSDDAAIAAAAAAAGVAGGTNAPTMSANSASQATFPLVALLAAFVVKICMVF